MDNLDHIISETNRQRLILSELCYALARPNELLEQIAEDDEGYYIIILNMLEIQRDHE
jgi:hypothetical protein